jgi:hypothetical protein
MSVHKDILGCGNTAMVRTLKNLPLPSSIVKTGAAVPTQQSTLI